MNILIITRGKLPLPNIKGGAVEYLIQLLLDENERKWHENFTVCTVYTDGLERAQEKYQYCRFLNIYTTGIMAKMETGVRYLINTRVRYVGNYFISQVFHMLGGDIEKFDAVIDENAPDFLPLIRKHYKGRFIFHAHNDWLDMKNAAVLNFCDEYWTISRYLADKVAGQPLSCDVHVLYNGIRMEDYETADLDLTERYRMKFQIEDDDVVLVYAGRLVEEKGVFPMLQAFVQAEFPQNVKLLVVGGAFYSSDDTTPYMRKCMEYAGDKKNILFTGYIDGMDMGAVYTLADIGVFPSLWKEPFGLTALEMMAGGLPVIATTNGAIPEVVKADCGILLSTEDEQKWVCRMSEAMKKLVNDKKLRLQMGEAGRKKAEEFEAPKYLERFYCLLRKEKAEKSDESDI